MTIARCIFFLLIFSPLAGGEQGRLIVTFETTSNQERLDRVRFWLQDPQGRQTFYPQGSRFVEDAKTHTRKVVVENLLPGPYEVEFLLPNRDCFFCEPPVKQVVIRGGETAKLHQVIKPFEDE